MNPYEDGRGTMEILLAEQEKRPAAEGPHPGPTRISEPGEKLPGVGI